MNKLTKIKEENKKWNEYFEQEHDVATLVNLEPVNRTITYLLSLLEEKDKALQEIIEAYDEGEQYFSTVRKMTRIARKALNTSSNSEGE